MSDLLTATDIHDCRTIWDNYQTRFTGGQIAATIDARDEEIARLRKQLRNFDICGPCSGGDHGGHEGRSKCYVALNAVCECREKPE